MWPEPYSSAAGSRILQLIDVFLAQNWKITFACAAADSDFMFDVAQLGIDKVNIKLNDSSFDEFIKALNPDLVLFDRFMIEEQFGWRVAENCPNTLRILDTEDLHSLRRARQNAFRENRDFTNEDLFSEVAKREVASILRCDLSLIISPIEMKILTDKFNVKESLLLLLPFLLPEITSTETEIWPEYESRKHFVSIGNFLHEPNWNAVQYLKQDIWPIIRKELPDAEMHVYGAYPSQKVLQLHKPSEGFLIKGRAENASDVVSAARICLAPLRFGAGLKGKLIEAMQCGTPSVTTDIGAEGMHKNLPWNGEIRNNAQSFAQAAIQLYSDKKSWELAQQNGIQIINQCYSSNLLSPDFLKKIEEIQQNLKQHRLSNFTGAMLMQQTTSATKYMSKWIEEKNKIRE